GRICERASPKRRPWRRPVRCPVSPADAPVAALASQRAHITWRWENGLDLPGARGDSCWCLGQPVAGRLEIRLLPCPAGVEGRMALHGGQGGDGHGLRSEERRVGKG